MSILSNEDTTMMTKAEYKHSRRLVRDNGEYALRWVHIRYRDFYHYITDQIDTLAERAELVEWCKKNNIQYNYLTIR